MSYVIHPAARTTARAVFADFSIKRAFEGPARVAHLLTIVGGLVPFYLFSSAHRGGLDNPAVKAESRYQQSLEARLEGKDPYLIYRQRTLAERRSKS